jgi:anti-sigma factor RsiW
MAELRHDQVEELLGAYALDAVTAEERIEVEAHLATCPRCRNEVDAHREVAAHLAQGGAAAPDHLWERIAGAIDAETPPPMRLVVDDAPPRARAPRWAWWPGLLGAAAAVAIIALTAGLLVVQNRVGDLEGERALAGAATAAFAEPGARTVDLEGDTGEVVARAALLPDGTGYVLAGGLPDLDRGIYQLWGQAGDAVVSLGTMGAAPDVVAFHADPAPERLLISVEEEPVPQPTTAPVALGALA